MIKVAINEINIEVGQAAVEQIQLMLTHDKTLKGQVFRLQIDGKGCNGFDYALGFSDPAKDDLLYPLKNSKNFLHIDPFTAYYCKEGTIDYICDFEKDIEGFAFNNLSEKKYRGKFFKDESMVPETHS